MPFEELKARLSEVWSAAPWERVAPMLAPVHEQLVRLLEPRPGLRCLDAATGTGAVAQLAARPGAQVVGVDLAPGLIATARRLAAEQGLEIAFEVGDAEALPAADASLDVLSSDGHHLRPRSRSGRPRVGTRHQARRPHRLHRLAGGRPVAGSSGEEVFQLLVESAGPMKARAETMPGELFQQFHADFVELFEQHRQGERVSVPGPYLVILGCRR